MAKQRISTQETMLAFISQVEKTNAKLGTTNDGINNLKLILDKNTETYTAAKKHGIPIDISKLKISFEDFLNSLEKKLEKEREAEEKHLSRLNAEKKNHINAIKEQAQEGNKAFKYFYGALAVLCLFSCFLVFVSENQRSKKINAEEKNKKYQTHFYYYQQFLEETEQETVFEDWFKEKVSEKKEEK